METTEPMTEDQAVKALMEQPEEPTYAAPETTEDVAELEDPQETKEAQADDVDEGEDVDTDAIEEGEPEAEEDTANLYTVKVDGEERKVDLDELRRGYSGQAHIQRGMQEVATARKELEQQVQQSQAERQIVLQAYEMVTNGQFVLPPVAPDPALAQTDPLGWTEQYAQFQAQQSQYDAQMQQIQQLQEQQSQAQAQQQRAALEAQEKKLIEAFPELKEPAKRKEFGQRLMTHAESYGYSHEEFAAVGDARAVAILADAANWRELQASKPAAQRKTESARPLKPGAKAQPGKSKKRADRINRARRTQSTDDWVNALLD